MTRTKLALAALALGTAGMAAAAVPNPAIPTKTFALFSQQVPKKGGVPKITYYKNEDATKTTSVTVKTPHVTTSVVPVLDKNGKQVVIKGVPQFKKVSTTTYTSVTTKSTLITPKAELYSTSGTTGTAFATPAVNFRYLVPLAPHYLGALNGLQNAAFSLHALSTLAVVDAGGELSQTFNSGVISFTRATPVHAVHGTFTGPAQSNLLTINFSNAVLTTRAGASTFTLSASTPTSVVAYSSDFLNFANSANNGFSLSFNAAVPVMSVATTDPTLTNVTGAHSFISTHANVGGQFSASSVPEPAVWSLLIAGFVMVGLRRRRPVTSIVAA